VYSTEQGYRKERGGTRTTAGVPDLIVIFDEAWTFAELKTPKGRLTTAQEGFRTACLSARIPWECWRSVDDAWTWAVRVGLVEEWEFVP
jgi:hypothetical protein